MYHSTQHPQRIQTIYHICQSADMRQISARPQVNKQTKK